MGDMTSLHPENTNTQPRVPLHPENTNTQLLIHSASHSIQKHGVRRLGWATNLTIGRQIIFEPGWRQ